ncbi:MAG: 23S rRNA (uracil(1939)-C(5))-methyltransferase RlmD, partial [Lachnospiraceae bacterium]
MFQKNDVITLKIDDMSHEGEGVGKVEGFTFFVKDSIIGDVIEAKVVKLKKTYGYGRLMKILEPSKDRVEPRCPIARPCGGCQLQAMSYESQLQFKQNKVKNNLERIGGFENLVMEPIIGMEEPWRYRNKCQVPVGTDKNGRVIFGFYAGRTHDIIEQEDCLLGVEENKAILEVIRKFVEKYHILPYSETTHTGLLRHVLIRKGFVTGELMVCLIINGKKIPHSEELAAKLREIEGMTDISININTNQTNVILGSQVKSLWGPGYITDYIGEVKYHISPQSFFQVNPVQTKKLYGKALEYAQLTGNEVVWDLYCGIGTISLFLAQKAKKVYGVEIVPAAIEDARANAKLNGLDNAEFFVGEAEVVLPEFYRREKVGADVIVVDPPRKGCEKSVLDTMIAMKPKRIVYVSCDSATLARDLRYLVDGGYQLEKVQAVDQFGQGVHVETVCLLSKLKSTQHIEV